MNMKRIGYKTFKVGNVNDYINLINKVNVNSNTSLTLDSFSIFQSVPNGTTIYYKIGPKDPEADFLLNSNDYLFINCFI